MQGEDNSMELLEEEPLLLTDEVKTEEISQQPIVLSPAVRKMVTEKDINLDNVKGTGKAGRILKGDLITMMGANPQPCLLYTSPSPRDVGISRMPSSA